MKVSVCITVKNEEGSIGRLIESLLNQTVLPNEIVIVDGGSTDNTLSEISKFEFLNSKQLQKINFKIIKTKNSGIAEGRNLAIEKAKNEIIVMIDAGCVAKKDWLEKITKPFTNNDDLLVAGYYDMPYETPLQQVMSVYHGIPPERYNEHKFLPSARSVAFSKSVWKNVGKFNEHLLKTGEDTEFFYNCVKTDVKIIRIKEARVVWEEILSWTLISGLRKFYEYAKGDAQIKSSHNIKISVIFIRYLIGLLLLIIGFRYPIFHFSLYIFISLYLLYPVAKWHDIIKSWQGIIWLPIMQILSDFGVMIGFIHGLFKYRS